jgi:hypothetical protein
MVQRSATLILPYTLEQEKQLPARFFSYVGRIERCDGCHLRRCIMNYSSDELLSVA